MYSASIGCFNFSMVDALAVSDNWVCLCSEYPNWAGWSWILPRLLKGWEQKVAPPEETSKSLRFGAGNLTTEDAFVAWTYRSWYPGVSNRFIIDIAFKAVLASLPLVRPHVLQTLNKFELMQNTLDADADSYDSVSPRPFRWISWGYTINYSKTGGVPLGHKKLLKIKWKWRLKALWKRRRPPKKNRRELPWPSANLMTSEMGADMFLRNTIAKLGKVCVISIS